MRIHVQECDHPHGHSEYAINCCKSYGYEKGEFIEQSGAVFCSRNETLSDIGNKIEKAMDEMKLKYEKKIKSTETLVQKCQDDSKKLIESMKRTESESKSLIERLLIKIRNYSNVTIV